MISFWFYRVVFGKPNRKDFGEFYAEAEPRPKCLASPPGQSCALPLRRAQEIVSCDFKIEGFGIEGAGRRSRGGELDCRKRATHVGCPCEDLPISLIEESTGSFGCLSIQPEPSSIKT
jgi:hypothetical protein